MSVVNRGAERSFAQRLSDYLQDADYRVAGSNADLEAVFSLRYQCYLREEAIRPNPEGQFHDAYDRMDNCWIFGIHLDDRLVSAIRFHVLSPEQPNGPAMDVFPDIVRPMINQGMTVIDPTRLVVDAQASRLYPELPFATMRVACMASEYFEADYCLATVRREHQAFYRRVFNFVPVCEPRPYPTLLKPIALLAGDMSKVRDQVAEKYPVFVSSYTERRLLFAEPRTGRGMEDTFRNVVNG